MQMVKRRFVLEGDQHVRENLHLVIQTASNALLKTEHVIKVRRKDFCWKVKEDLENKLEFNVSIEDT